LHRIISWLSAFVSSCRRRIIEFRMRWALPLLVAAAIPAFAADQWIRIVTPDFELYTTAGEKAGREAIEHFEQVRGFFLKASPVRSASDSPVRIFAFKSLDQFRPYSINGVASAFFTSDPMRDYIVMSSPAPADFPVAIHEYMHLIVRHSGLKLPVWLNEGWADLYSTLRPMGKETAVGDLLPGRMQELAREQWLDFDALTSVDQRSAIYNESSRVGIFYAESWALTHMLYLSPEYQDNFGKFVLALNSGRSAADALQIAWGRTPEQVFADLRGYFERKKIFGRAFAASLQKPEDAPVSTVLPDFDARLALADLLVAVDKPNPARLEYDRLDKEQPGRADVSGSLGYLALRDGDRAGARARFEQALSAGTSDARLCYSLANLEREAGQPPAKRMAPLERALQLNPDYDDARLQLGLTQVDMRAFPAAIATLMRIPTVTPERAPPLFSALAFAKLQTGDVDAARRDAETARKWVRTPAEKVGVDQLLKLIDARSKGAGAAHPGETVQQAAGSMWRVECSPAGSHLLLQSERGLMTFDLPPAEAVEFTHHSGGGSLNITCGKPMTLPVVVEYALPVGFGSATAGVVRRLEY
jgi:tetratricopeptide (TPR) repeat protein